jgi:hypothetical protein
MNAALQDFHMIWRAAAAQREAQGVRIMGMGLGAVAICAAILMASAAAMGTLGTVQGLRLLIGFTSLALVLVWSFLFVPGSIRMNSPANAWLLPRQRRRMLQMTTAYWLLVTAGMAFGIGHWIALPAVALSVLGLALLCAGNKHVVILLVLGGNWPWLSRVVLPPAWGDAATGGGAALVLGLFVVPAAVWGLRWLYPARGDAYIARRADQMRRVSHFDQCGVDKQPAPDGMAWHGNLAFYLVALRCNLRRADPGAMLLHALGPSAHWTAWIGGIVTLLIAGGVIRLVLVWTHAAGVQSLVGWMMSVGPALLALTIAFSTAQYGQQLRRTQGEQALLRLTPLAGDAALLNRRLAGRVLRQALGCWAALTVAMMAVSLLIDAGPDALLRQLGLCSLAGQVAMMGLLGDYANGAGGWHLMLGLRAGALAAAQALVAVGIGWITGTTAWPWLVLLPLTVCCVLLRLDWQCMLAAPPAFPAGRTA